MHVLTRTSEGMRGVFIFEMYPQCGAFALFEGNIRSQRIHGNL